MSKQDAIKEKLKETKDIKQLNDEYLEKVTGGTGNPSDPGKPETESGLRFDLQVLR